MRDVGEQLLVAVDESFDAGRHPVEVLRETGDFIAAAMEVWADSGGQVAISDVGGGGLKAKQGAGDVTGDQEAEGAADQDDHDETPIRGQRPVGAAGG